ncbi:phosphatase PAP2 family protein [Actinomadura sp. PM05-2]|uniref:Phosphatase PAP2 family protein n=1 Tax=Actinomadura parmotrematis TaxID=2864039 RepID=A0ABS7FKA7_9ACTN|nr:phosphatase PAP2 family protein [Actinomadura parmotrematis]
MWRELLLIALFYAGYTLTRIVLVQDGTGPAFAHAHTILGWERALGIDVELDLNHTLLMVPWLARTANFFYATAHFAVTLALVAWLYRYRPQHYRWLRTALMAATAVAVLGFWLYPLAPPRFLPDQGFVDPVTALHSFGLYASDASGSLTNQYAAMPSMHAGWALWCGVVLVRVATQRWARVLGVLYPTTTVLVILSTANHYLLDAVVGMAIIGAALGLSWLAYHRCPDGVRRRRARIGERVAERLLWRGAPPDGAPAGPGRAVTVAPGAPRPRQSAP